MFPALESVFFFSKFTFIFLLLLTYRTFLHTEFLASVKSFDVGQAPFYPLKLCWHQTTTVNQCYIYKIFTFYRFLVSVDTQDTDCRLIISPTRLSLSLIGLPIPFDYDSSYVVSVHTPILFLIPVWPLPISLATTFGISFDFSSSPYLDVSVREVPFLNLCIQLRIYDSSP